ncbi:TlpA disulfide reductase family protein [Amycolatopsis cihanbeyliensis]|uniref:Thiol-disulfide isomerase/thioredoxin n=1 Tax=Amycolatopsis cihanbeyliensis TaxID=1128664 RepID=A0A542DJR6_AMYCI|nr:TlpA disulfide reductase family protein [Amycolatopsis cihanbeyliensis]TQJ03338.1 thiol-disulfide isomerase/thioredoxin [Amycolatopsis cihanbeyliensis]
MRRLRTLLACLLCVAALAACSTGEDAVTQGGDFEFVSPGGEVDIFYEDADRQRIPELTGEDLFQPGEQISVADYAGKVVVLNIWGQWCDPCRAEAPEMQKLYEQTRDEGVQVLGLDVRETDRAAPQDFMRNRGLTYPSIYDESGRSMLALRGYPRNAVPSTIVVDKRQRVAAVFLRALLAEDLLPVVRRLAAE